MNVLSRLVIPSLFAVAITTLGCGGGSVAICEKFQECSGGNDADLDACIASADGVAAVAAAYDCGDQYAKYAECLEAKGTCSGKSYTADCGDEDDALDACQKAATANK